MKCDGDVQMDGGLCLYCLPLGFQDFLFGIILAIGVYLAWLPKDFSKNKSHFVVNHGVGSRVV